MSDMAAAIIPIIRGVRAIVMPQYGNPRLVERKNGDAYNLVTGLDRAVELHLQAKLHAAFPEIGFVGEEYGGDRSARCFWLCDPIDGTMHFVRGTPWCTTMLALVKDGIVRFSAIYDFVHDIVYWAERGKGAYANDERIRVSDAPAASAILCSETRDLSLAKTLMSRMPMLKLFCAGYEFVLVATGKAEGRITLDPYGYDYDYAPGALLVEEAGGIVRNIGSRGYDYRNLDSLAANPALFAALTEGPEALFPLA